MDIYARTSSVDMGPFKGPAKDTQPKYGLPQAVTFCKRCVVSNQRPNSAIEYAHTSASTKPTIAIDKDGICDACKVAEQKEAEIDWQARERELRALCDRYRRNDGSYDCVVPGSGGKDSIYAAHVLKYEYGMHPLTVTWAPHIYTPWGWENFQNWLHAGFDNLLNTPNGRVHRLLTRLAVENLFHPFQPFIIGQKSIAARFSVLYNIPLVFYGENEAEYGNPKGDTSTAQRRWDYCAAHDDSEIFLSGVSIAELGKRFGVDRAELQPYLPVNPEGMKRVGTEVHYLGYYLKWHPQSAYYYSVDHANFKASPERTPGTYSKYNSIDDKMDDLHYFTTFIKFGIGRATYDASQEVRSGDITREEAVALVQRYDGEFPERFFEEQCRYLSLPEEEFPEASKAFEQPEMDRDYFMHLADRFRSPHIWKHENGTWSLRNAVWMEG